jgi:hypothetical protein
MELEAHRRFTRVPLAASVTLTLEEGGQKHSVEAMAADISFSGIGLYVGRHIEEGTALTIEINFIANVGKVKTEAVKGSVIFSNYIRKAYLIGVDFPEELSPESQPDLYERIRGILELS